MKLAILAHAYLEDKTAPINGSLVQLYNLSHGLQKNDIEIHYIAATKDKTKTEFELSNGIHFHWIQKKDNFLEWKHVMKLYEHKLNQVQPDAVYVRGRNTLQYVAGNYAKKNKKVYVWGTNGDDSAEFWKNIKRLKSSNKSIIKKAILFPLKALEDSYINKGMKMPNYIVNQNTYQKQKTSELLKRKGILLNSYYLIDETKDSTHKNVVLWLARWAPEKQPEIFIDIVSKLHFPEVQFVMAGDSTNSNKSSIILNKSEKNNIEFPGKIPYNEVNNYFAKALIFVNTSYKEGVSNTFIEAMLHGVPVLSLNSNPNNWLIDYDIGYCANGNIADLTNKIDELLSNRDKLQQLSVNAKVFAQKQFSNNNIIKNYIKLFNGNG